MICYMHVFERVALFLVLLTAEAGFCLGRPPWLKEDYTCPARPAYACSVVLYNSVRCNNFTDHQWWNSPKCQKLRDDEGKRRRNQKKNKLPFVGVITLDGERSVLPQYACFAPAPMHRTCTSHLPEDLPLCRHNKLKSHAGTAPPMATNYTPTM